MGYLSRQPRTHRLEQRCEETADAPADLLPQGHQDLQDRLWGESRARSDYAGRPLQLGFMRAGPAGLPSTCVSEAQCVGPAGIGVQRRQKSHRGVRYVGRRDALDGEAVERPHVGMEGKVECSYVFGLNNWGQLGNGRRRERPELIQRVPFFDGKEVVSAALGQHSTLVLTDDGKLYSAGRNSYGQLGRETIDECDAEFGEVELPKGVRFQQIAAGYHHFIAIDEFGRLYTMGFGEMQQLGNGDKYEDESRLYRVKSEELETRRVVFAAGGSQHTLILTEKLFIVCSTNMGSRQRH